MNAVQESGVHVLYDRWIYFIRRGWRSLVQGVEKNAVDWRGWGRGWVENVLGSTNTRPVYAWASKPPLHSSRLCRCCRRRRRRRRHDARRRQTLGFRLMDHFSFLDSTRRSPTSLRAHPYDHLPAPSKLPSSAILSSSSFPPPPPPPSSTPTVRMHRPLCDFECGGVHDNPLRLMEEDEVSRIMLVPCSRGWGSLVSVEMIYHCRQLSWIRRATALPRD